MSLTEADHRNGATKGILFAADSGASLHPTAQVIPKGLIPVYDKPMIYYPLCTLMLAGTREILVVCPPRHLRSFMELLGNGSRLGISISYAEHHKGEGTGNTFLTAERFIGEDSVYLILGDTILHGASDSLRDPLPCEEGATIFVSQAKNANPHAFAEHDTIENAPRIACPAREGESRSRSGDYVATGLYGYSNDVVEIARLLVESCQGELELAEVNREYFRRGELRVRRLSHDVTWLDASTASSLLETARFIADFERRRGLKLGCIEDAAFRMGFISPERFERLIGDLPKNSYREYLERVASTSSKDQPETRQDRLTHQPTGAISAVG